MWLTPNVWIVLNQAMRQDKVYLEKIRKQAMKITPENWNKPMIAIISHEIDCSLRRRVLPCSCNPSLKLEPFTNSKK